MKNGEEKSLLFQTLTRAIYNGADWFPAEHIEGEDAPEEEVYDEDNIEYYLDVKRISDEFLHLWFFNGNNDEDNDGHYGSFFFLHYKSSSVTDIIYSEIKSLIQYDVKDYGDQSVKAVFYSNEQIKDLVTNFLSSLIMEDRRYTDDDVENIAAQVIEKYSGIFETALIIDHYYTSTTVHVPSSLRLDIRKITCESGYIHSAGSLLYIRRMDKTHEKDVKSCLSQYISNLEQRGELGNPISLTPYANEFFNKYEKFNSVVSTRNGLDNVKFSIAKQYVGSTRLSEFLPILEEEFEGKIIIPSGLKNYESERLEQGADPSTTIWILSDYAVSSVESPKKSTRDDTRYLVVYAQLIFNQNQFITLKERKPAWYAPVTMPSTLSAALINSTRPRHAHKNNIKILDPFCGTGTFLIDAAVRYKNASLFGMDKNPLFKNIISDNLHFFSQTNGSQLEKIYDPLFSALGLNEFNLETTKIDDLNFEEVSKLKLIRHFYDSGKITQNNQIVSAIDRIITDQDFLDAEFLRFIGNLDLIERFQFYVQWRALVSNRYYVSRGDDGLKNALFSELTQLKREIVSIKETLNGKIDKNDNLYFSNGLYSKSGFINPNSIKRLNDTKSIITSDENAHSFISNGQTGLGIYKTDDSIDALQRIVGMNHSTQDNIKFDIIITDPPYGVNTSEGGPKRLFDLFANTISTLVQCLADDGELVITLPDFTRNGQQIPFYQTKDFIVPALRTVLAKHDYDHGTFSIREHYWSSPSVLDRTITYVRMR
jgi:16S rRNA G966 N2-methylase RsmD